MDELARRGFSQVDNFVSGNTRYSIQWRAASKQCVQVTIADGHFYDLSDIGQHPKCRRPPQIGREVWRLPAFWRVHGGATGRWPPDQWRALPLW
jgi:hypothetical protein